MQCWAKVNPRGEYGHRQCSREAEAGDRFCYQHQEPAPIDDEGRIYAERGYSEPCTGCRNRYALHYISPENGERRHFVPNYLEDL